VTTTLVLTEGIAREIRDAAKLPVETAGVLIAGVAKCPKGDLRLLAQELRWVPDFAYRKRERDELVIGSEGYVEALGIAESQGAMAIWLHTHPGANALPIPSELDAVVDDHIADVFRLRTGSEYYGSVIFNVDHKGSLAFTGTLSTDKSCASIDRIVEVGSRLRLIGAYGVRVREREEIFDRQVRAFGGMIQDSLSSLRVAVVGCGGTGSAVSEQLVRLGVRDLILVDPDELTSSNVTRVYGSFARDVGRAKVDILRSHLLKIASTLKCESVKGAITRRSVAEQLISADVVFGCTDDNAGRVVLSRMATFLLSLVIDCGVLLSSDADGNIRGVDGRITILSPGAACLVCRGRIDMRRAGIELMAPGERKRLVEEGYAPALGNIEPAVVAYTTAVASAAVNELLERMVGYGPEPRPSEILLRIHEREISTNCATPGAGHYCDPKARRWGLGVTEPFLEQVWPE
jgi:molybdopterin/thiamine biosynthesis adenylyltransferase/proteasome lid subunit RPN8/RPN11